MSAFSTSMSTPESAYIGPALPRNDDRSFGVTQSTKFPPFVYSSRGALVHRVVGLDLWWYGLVNMTSMRRLRAPRYLFRTACGMTFGGIHRDKARVCVRPEVDAVMCGRCAGRGPVFGPKGSALKDGLTMRAARQRLGCIPEGESL